MGQEDGRRSSLLTKSIEEWVSDPSAYSHYSLNPALCCADDIRYEVPKNQSE